MDGWIKSHRAIMDNPIVCKDAEYYAVWGYLLHHAAYVQVDDFFNGKRIKLQPGQLITGRKKIASKFKINESKVYRILKCFENEQQIEQQTSNASSLITILNWQEYQSSEQQTEQPVNNQRTTTEQPVNTIIRNKEYKEVKEIKNTHTQTSLLNFSSRAREMLDWMNENTPKFKSMEFPLRQDQAESIVKRLPPDDITRILIHMYDKGVQERCKSVYQSFLRYEQQDYVIQKRREEQQSKIYRRKE